MKKLSEYTKKEIEKMTYIEMGQITRVSPIGLSW